MDLLLNFLPDWIPLAVVIAGGFITFISIVLNGVPGLSMQGIFTQILGLPILLAGIWFYSQQHFYQEMKAEVERINKESEAATAAIEAKYKQQLEQTRKKGEAIQKAAKTAISAKADAACTIPNNVVELHDAAAENRLPDSARVVDEEASTTKLSTTTQTVTDNYTSCNEVREQLSNLQRWIEEQRKIRE
jgi:hypothetical protein